jgi:hypothetical protein
MHLWDRFLPHAVITLNILRKSSINTKLSAHTHLYGQYDYNRAPMTPPGTIILTHETPNRRRTWAPPPMNKMDGMVDRRWSITDATQYTQPKP